jgi:hypothetical protein
MKTCTKCSIEKAYSAFYKCRRNRDGYNSHCKACCAESHKKWREKDLESVRAKAREADKKYRINNPDANKKKLAKLYGLTVEQYKEVLSRNNGLCCICNTEPATRLDHCHSTGKVRGGLCNKHNMALGLFSDDIQYLQNAVEYLSN